MTNDSHDRRLRIGVLGCGPICQSAHFDAIRKSRNAELYAICDVAVDLLERMNVVHRPAKTYADFADMLADKEVDAVLIGVADQYHVPLAIDAIRAGKHVLIEKPLGTTIEECEGLRDALAGTKLVLQVGHNRRFDPGYTFAREFIDTEIGELMAIKAWYCDSTVRYTMTDNLQPIIETSDQIRRPPGNPKADRRRYYMLGHGSHLVDTARFIGGEIEAVRATLVEKFGAYCWFVTLDYANGAVGHLDLTIAVRGDFSEGFNVYGEAGSVRAEMPLTWYHKSSVVECYSAKQGVIRKPLGEDGHTYRRQIEGFADVIRNDSPMHGANIDDGIAGMRTMAAIARSVETGEKVRLADVTGGV